MLAFLTAVTLLVLLLLCCMRANKKELGYNPLKEKEDVEVGLPVEDAKTPAELDKQLEKYMKDLKELQMQNEESAELANRISNSSEARALVFIARVRARTKLRRMKQKGVLRVRALRADILPPSGGARPGPIVVLEAGTPSATRTSASIATSLTPEWSEQFQFMGTLGQFVKSGVSLRVYDKVVAADKHLGECHVEGGHVESFAARRRCDKQFSKSLRSSIPVTSASSAGSAASSSTGTLSFSISWEPIGVEPAVAEAVMPLPAQHGPAEWQSHDAEGVLKIHLVRASGLMAADLNARGEADSSDPYAVIRCGGKKVTSKVVWKNLDPEWNEVFEMKGKFADFFSNEGKERGLQLKFYDKDRLKFDDPLGEVWIGLAEVIDQGHHAYKELLHAPGSLKAPTATPSAAASEGGPAFGDVTFKVTWLAKGKSSPPVVSTPGGVGTGHSHRRGSLTSGRASLPPARTSYATSRASSVMPSPVDEKGALKVSILQANNIPLPPQRDAKSRRRAADATSPYAIVRSGTSNEKRGKPVKLPRLGKGKEDTEVITISPQLNTELLLKGSLTDFRRDGLTIDVMAGKTCLVTASLLAKGSERDGLSDELLERISARGGDSMSPMQLFVPGTAPPQPKYATDPVPTFTQMDVDNCKQLHIEEGATASTYRITLWSGRKVTVSRRGSKPRDGWRLGSLPGSYQIVSVVAGDGGLVYLRPPDEIAFEKSSSSPSSFNGDPWSEISFSNPDKPDKAAVSFKLEWRPDGPTTAAFASSRFSTFASGRTSLADASTRSYSTVDGAQADELPTVDEGEEGEDEEEVQTPRDRGEVGVLTLHLSHATDLQAAMVDGGPEHLFVTVHYSGATTTDRGEQKRKQEKSSKMVLRAHDPVWEQTLRLYGSLRDLKEDGLLLQIFGKGRPEQAAPDDEPQDQLIGACRVWLGELHDDVREHEYTESVNKDSKLIFNVKWTSDAEVKAGL
jgi:hypothetical protein